MPSFYQDFVIEHEKGHFINDTRSEFEADSYAFKKLAGTRPQSLKNSVFSISRVLSFRNPEHMERMTEMVKMALEFDYRNNSNEYAKVALDELKTIIENNKNNNFYMDNSQVKLYYDSRFGESEYAEIYDNASGRARRQTRKTARVAKRQNKRQNRVAAKATRKQTRVAARVSRKNTRVAGRAANRSITNAYYPAEENIMPQDEQMYNNPESSYPDDVTVQQEYPDQSVDGEMGPVEDELQSENQEEEETETFFGFDGECLNQSYYDDSDFDNGAGKARRQAKRAKKQSLKEERSQLKNDRLKAKNEIKLSRADAKRTKADAKKTLADQGKSGTDWIGGAVDGVLGLFGKGKSKIAEAEVAGDSSALAADNSASSGKLLGMPKGVAIAVIIVLVLAIIGAVVFFLKRKK